MNGSKTGSHRHCVLVVEDHPDIREALAYLLELRGIEVRTAGDGAGALDLLRSGAPCCLVLLDWRMPRMDGAAFVEAHAADASIAAIPIVVTSADAAVMALDPRPPSIRAIVAKPIDPSGLTALIDRECAQRRRPAPPAPTRAPSA